MCAVWSNTWNTFFFFEKNIFSFDTRTLNSEQENRRIFTINRTIPSQIVRLLNTKYHYDRCNTKFKQEIIFQVQEQTIETPICRSVYPK